MSALQQWNGAERERGKGGEKRYSRGRGGRQRTKSDKSSCKLKKFPVILELYNVACYQL
jgi:hypothetical protein